MNNIKTEAPFCVSKSGDLISINQGPSSIVIGPRSAENLIEMLSVLLKQSNINLAEEKLPSISEIAQGSSYLFGVNPHALSDNFNEEDFYKERK